MIRYREDFDFETRFSLKDEIKNYIISTVDLGINAYFGMNNEPLYYETMVFKDNVFIEIYCERYSTKKEAEEGHLRAIKWVKEQI